MDGAGGRGGHGSAERQAPDLEALARDWITLWQSELAALAADREAQEMWQSWLAVWAGMAAAMVRTLPRTADDGTAGGGARHDGHAGGGRPAAPARPAPAAAAPDPRDAEIERLARHIGELERRLAALERRG
jgi:ubiquinone biosynthesis protein UbiJ